jgi:hypothetical protein
MWLLRVVHDGHGSQAATAVQLVLCWNLLAVAHVMAYKVPGWAASAASVANQTVVQVHHVAGFLRFAVGCHGPIAWHG